MMYKINIFGSLILIVIVSMIGCGKSSTIDNSAYAVTPTLAESSSVTPTMIPTKAPESSSASTNTEKQEAGIANALIDNVSAVYMKGSETGWALLWDGSLVTTNNAWDSYKQIYKFKNYDKNVFHPSITYVDGTLMVFGYFSNDYGIIDIYKSKNEGNSWSISHIKDSDIALYGGGDIFNSFINNQNGYLLCCGEPAMGLMPKYLFKTEDGGETYTKVADVSYIDGYPTGLAFNRNGEGFITSTYHGNNKAYLYCSSDKGKTWNTSTITPPKNISYAYINSYPPYFIEKDGFMILEYVNQAHDCPQNIMFHSSDNGKTWEVEGDVKLKSTAIISESFINKRVVYLIDDTGKLLKKVNENHVWN